MGIIHSSDRQKGVTFIVWDGEIIWSAWLKHVEELMNDPEWHVMPRFIADLQSVTNTSSIGDEVVEQVAATIRMHAEVLTLKTGAVVASEEFWRAQKFGNLLSQFGTSTIVFNTLDTACLFLGLDLATTQQTIEQLRLKLRNA